MRVIIWFLQHHRIREEEADGMGDWREDSAVKRIPKLSLRISFLGEQGIFGKHMFSVAGMPGPGRQENRKRVVL